MLGFSKLTNRTYSESWNIDRDVVHYRRRQRSRAEKFFQHFIDLAPIFGLRPLVEPREVFNCIRPLPDTPPVKLNKLFSGISTGHEPVILPHP
jgi:hypothetical protein